MSIESDILQITKQGKNVTHILKINIEGTETNKTTIIDFIYRCINNNVINKSCHGNELKVKWNTFDKFNYYTDSLLYNDAGIKIHTDKMMDDLISELNQSAIRNFKVNYHLMKPLSTKVVLL
jgi:hypothetical protein